MVHPTIAELVERSKESAKVHKPASRLAELSARGEKMSGTLIITCIDPRCVPETIFNLKAEEAIVHRNGGGRVRTALADIAILRIIIAGGLDEVLVMHHTDCGCLRYTDDGLRAKLKSTIGPGHDELIDGLYLSAIDKLENSVREDLKLLKESPLVPKELAENAQGFIFDIATGEVARVQ
ncbi:carbonic anhydrase [Paraphoma chrysanthemicola]|uniref:Carbonic anhydrase n=1 Tax=Paraphoma chrysanthemicola TaxID=798071 RepID=A0A8K0RKG0_9PLEO|nr:carbonic anhydrase [Paraphoma chrysanthemicola]